MLRPAGEPTIGDVALKAGVSMSTASRAVSGRGYVSSAVRELVRSAAEELGYIPHEHARNLRSGTSSDIGVLVSNFRDTYYSELATAIEASLREGGFNMMLMTDNGREAAELAAVDTLAAKRVAGVILTPVSTRVIRRLARTGMPIVQADRTVGGDHTDAVIGDNEAGARCATEHLIDRGHRNIAMLIDESKWSTGRDRVRGFRQAYENANLRLDNDLIIFAPGNLAAIRRRVGILLDHNSDVTAMVAGNGLLAEGAFIELQARGISIPDDMSLVAYDDVPWMSMVRPGITSIAQHTDEIGKACASLLIRRLTEEPSRPPSTTSIPPSLIVRGSVRGLVR